MTSRSVQKDLGVMQALFHQSSTVELPRVLRIRQYLMSGRRMAETDVTFVGEVCDSAAKIQPLVDRHQEYQEYYARKIMLLHEITSLALANEGNPQ
jgi:hypothetical protein